MNAPAIVDTAEAEPLVDTRFTVPGMRCAGCIAKIERGLAKLEGVNHARVNFSARRVAVRHEISLSEEQLTEELRQLGFEAQALAVNPLAQDDREARTLLRALAVAGFGMMNIMLLSVSVWSGAGGVTRGRDARDARDEFNAALAAGFAAAYEYGPRCSEPTLPPTPAGSCISFEGGKVRGVPASTRATDPSPWDLP